MICRKSMGETVAPRLALCGPRRSRIASVDLSRARSELEAEEADPRHRRFVWAAGAAGDQRGAVCDRANVPANRFASGRRAEADDAVAPEPGPWLAVSGQRGEEQ